MKDYIKRKLALLSIALARVEKQSLNQASDAVGESSEMIQTYQQGSLADALLKGEITMPVKELRWRMYKVLNESQNLKSKIVGYGDDKMPIVETYKIDKVGLSGVKCDDIDDYKVEIFIKNEDVIKSTVEAFNYETLNILNDEEIKTFKDTNDKFDLPQSKTYDVFGDEIVSEETEESIEEKKIRTLGTITFNDMITSMKTAKTLLIGRDLKPKFEIEKYTKHLLVRKINENEKMIEFHVSKYPDEYDRRSRLFLSELKKWSETPRKYDSLDINAISFITNKTIGMTDGLFFEYNIKSFDKIIEFDGNYVIKFIADVNINGVNIFEQFKIDELEKKYQNKEAK